MVNCIGFINYTKITHIFIINQMMNYLVWIQDIAQQFINGRVVLKNDEVEEKTQKLLNNSVWEKYHINVCKNGVVLLK